MKVPVFGARLVDAGESLWRRLQARRAWPWVALFAFLGGVTQLIVCDNLKAAVTNPDRYEPGLNRTYADMARHYGTTIVPARPYKPRDSMRNGRRPG